MPLRPFVADQVAGNGGERDAGRLGNVEQFVGAQIAEDFNAPRLGLLGELGFAGLANLQVVGGNPLAGLVVSDGTGGENADGAVLADADGGFNGVFLEDFDADLDGLVPVALRSGADLKIVAIQELRGRPLVGFGLCARRRTDENEPGRYDREPGGDPLSHENLENRVTGTPAVTVCPLPA